MIRAERNGLIHEGDHGADADSKVLSPVTKDALSAQLRAAQAASAIAENELDDPDRQVGFFRRTMIFVSFRRNDQGSTTSIHKPREPLGATAARSL
ncbi:hypothetical protein EC957_000868 [Mortierella hygrophila]|uniref:Uncharacterized protein n=1 Tax=Mortierella hygrophila TaxID=979708 RepID=A0A9P6F5H4_9FUNG|nr:hypothetical protein EC957_000868 [Mortierella hygrophila]